MLFLTDDETRLSREKASEESTIETQDKDVLRFNFHEARSTCQQQRLQYEAAQPRVP